MFNFIESHYKTLAFCKRWLFEEKVIDNALPLKELVDANVVNDYPPLCDVSGSYVA